MRGGHEIRWLIRIDCVICGRIDVDNVMLVWIMMH